MKTIALINLSSIPQLQIQSVYPVGLSCLASYLRKHGFHVDIIDFLDNLMMYESLEFIDKNYDFIGFSIRNMELDTLNGNSFFCTYRIFITAVEEAISKTNLNTKTFLGGAGLSVFFKQLDLSFFNGTVIVGNGENLVLKFVEGKLCDKKIYLNDSNDHFKNLDIEYDQELVKRYISKGNKSYGMDEIGIPTHRGQCVEACAYCAYKNIEIGKNVYREIDLVRKNIIDLYNVGVRHIFFSDSLFNDDIQYAKDICQMIIDLNYNDLVWKAYFSLNLDNDLLGMLEKSRCSSIYISFDTFSPAMINTLNKNFELADAVKLIRTIRKYQTPLKAFILFGGPSENEKTIQETCSFINQHLKKDELLIALGVRVLPNSKIASGFDENTLLGQIFYPFDKKCINYILKYLENDKLNFDNFWRLMLVKESLGV